MAEETGVNVYINAIDNTAAGTASASRNVEALAGRVTATDALMQQQMARERQVEQMLLSHGITPSAGSGSLRVGQLRSLGLTEAELGSLGMGAAGRGGGNQYERVLAGRMAGLGNIANLMGFSGPMVGVGAAALGVGAGAQVLGDLIGDYRENEKATKDLTQAYREAGLDYATARRGIEKWIDSNSQYIDNVDSAREGFAKLTRAGIDQSNITKAMNDALNLAALKGISFSQALEQVLLGAEGNTRGLKDLGIQVKDYQDLTASGAKAQEQITAATLVAKDADVKLTDSRLTARDADIRVTDAHIRLKTAVDNYGAGSSQAKLAQDALSIAVDNAKKAHDAVGVAVDASTKAHQKLTDTQDIMANKAGAQAQYFDDLGTKTKDGVKSIDDLSKAQNDLSATMHTLADDVGPAALASLTGFTEALDIVALNIKAFFDWLPNLGATPTHEPSASRLPVTLPTSSGGGAARHGGHGQGI